MMTCRSRRIRWDDGLCSSGKLVRPGHNFWPGSPVSWWMRGCLAFMMMTGPIAIAWLLIVLMAKRTLNAWRWTLPLLFIVLFAIWANGLNMRDGNMPWFRGGVWGQRIAPWLTLVAASLPAAILLPARKAPARH